MKLLTFLLFFAFCIFFSFLVLVPLQNKLVFPAEGHSVNSAGDRGRGEVRERNEEMGKTREGKGVGECVSGVFVGGKEGVKVAAGMKVGGSQEKVGVETALA